ncbi:hypothetical protein H5410_037003 [Solanum commersonii]|uniref:DUF4283 domain-containing protein n=1 Tax=Solanum commersonii TaxID=4109 RepID=A0A9J5Y533_SOLCO|nr:hypothetical protein H5410_037003 [Solanum commersonii]
MAPGPWIVDPPTTPTTTNISIGNYEVTTSPNKGTSKPSLPKEVSFASSINPFGAYRTYDCITQKEVSIKEGEPYIRWTEEDVSRMNKIKSLQFAVSGKVSYEWSNLEELRRSIPQQSGIKERCQIGIPVQLDLAMTNKTRPSCARVKMDIENEATGDIRSEIVLIKYDYLPKYCSGCKIQGHDMEECLLLRQSKVKESCKEQRAAAIPMPKVHSLQKGKARILSSGKVVGDLGNWNVGSNQHTEKQSTEKREILVKNKLNALSEEMTITKETIVKVNSQKMRENVQLLDKQKGEERETTKKTKHDNEILTTKDWINKAFGKFMQCDSSSKNDHKYTESGVPLTENQLAIVNKNVKKASNNNSSQSQLLIMNASEEFISLTDKVSYTNQSLAIMEVPTAMQTDDSQVIMVKPESPNKILHDIINDKVGEHSEVGKCGAYQCAIPTKEAEF